MNPRGSSGVWEAFIPGLGKGDGVQVPHPLALSHVRGGQGRPLRLLPRGAAADGVHRVGPGVRVGRRRVDADAPRAQHVRRADVDLRSASRLVDARAGRRQPLAELSRAGAQAGRLRERAGLHPRRVHAGHGASVLRLVGLPGHRLLRAQQPLRHAAGLHVPGGLPAPARHRRDSRLGAVALSQRRARAGLLRRHASVRARRSAQGLSSRLEVGHLQLRPQRGARLPAQQRDLLARPLSRRRTAHGRHRLHAVPRLLAQAGRVDSQPVWRAREPGSRVVPEAGESRTRIRRFPTSRPSPRSPRRGRWCRGRPISAGWASA